MGSDQKLGGLDKTNGFWFYFTVRGLQVGALDKSKAQVPRSNVF